MNKQKTLEEAAERFVENWFKKGNRTVEVFKAGAKWQQERSYSEEEVYQLLYDLSGQILKNKVSNPKLLEEWFNKFKKK